MKINQNFDQDKNSPLFLLPIWQIFYPHLLKFRLQCHKIN